MTSKTTFFKSAPMMILGAIFLFASCKEKSTSKWDGANTPESEQAPAPPPPAPSEKQEEAAKKQDEATETTKVTPPVPVPATSPEGIRFLSYNIKNYLRMDRWINDERVKDAHKPEEEIAALVKIIVAEKPDVLGLCEIGTKEDLADLQSRLKKAGLDLPHSEYAFGWDHTRRLGLLSKFPISARNSQDKLFYKLGDSDMQISRGLLHATIDLPVGPTHFIGGHLKSKREIPNHSQELMRQNEALLIRKHCNKIIDADPDARIFVYGDMNDTRKTPALANLKGRLNSIYHLEDILVTDSRGEVWTHAWHYQHVYSRFDYVLVSKAAKDLVDAKHSYIVDSPEWETASDHRAIMILIKEK